MKQLSTYKRLVSDLVRYGMAPARAVAHVAHAYCLTPRDTTALMVACEGDKP